MSNVTIPFDAIQIDTVNDHVHVALMYGGKKMWTTCAPASEIREADGRSLGVGPVEGKLPLIVTISAA